MDKDRRVSIETISAQFDVSVGTVHTIIREELEMWKICAQFVPTVLREDQKERRCHDSREMVELINLDPAVLDALVTCDESWIYCYEPQTKRQSFQWKHAGSPRPKKARQSKSTHKLLMIPFFFWQHWHDLHALGSHWTDSQQGILWWGFKGVQEEIPSKIIFDIMKSYSNRPVGLLGRVFTSGPGDRGLIPGRVLPKTQKLVLDATLLNT